MQFYYFLNLIFSTGNWTTFVEMSLLNPSVMKLSFKTKDWEW